MAIAARIAVEWARSCGMNEPSVTLRTLCTSLILSSHHSTALAMETAASMMSTSVASAAATPPPAFVAPVG